MSIERYEKTDYIVSYKASVGEFDRFMNRRQTASISEVREFIKETAEVKKTVTESTITFDGESRRIKNVTTNPTDATRKGDDDEYISAQFARSAGKAYKVAQGVLLFVALVAGIGAHLCSGIDLKYVLAGVGAASVLTAALLQIPKSKILNEQLDKHKLLELWNDFKNNELPYYRRGESMMGAFG